MPRQLPPLNALKAFEATARSESFTRASEELCVTQGAVSHQVKALEATLAYGQKIETCSKAAAFQQFLVLGRCCTTSLPWTLEEGRRGSQAILDTAG